VIPSAENQILVPLRNPQRGENTRNCPDAYWIVAHRLILAGDPRPQVRPSLVTTVATRPVEHVDPSTTARVAEAANLGSTSRRPQNAWKSGRSLTLRQLAPLDDSQISTAPLFWLPVIRTSIRPPNPRWTVAAVTRLAAGSTRTQAFPS
jgi:hypothetical protein